MKLDKKNTVLFKSGILEKSLYYSGNGRQVWKCGEAALHNCGMEKINKLILACYDYRFNC